MSYFPFFIDLKGKQCVVIGGGMVSLRKIRTLCFFEAEVTVIAPEVCKEIECLRVNIKRKEFTDEDLVGAFLVIAATDEEVLNQNIVRICLERGILVNSATKPAEGTFLFPGTVKKKDITIGICTSGKSPGLTKLLCEKFNEEIPPNWGELPEVMYGIRKELKERIKEQQIRRQILYEIMCLALDGTVLTQELIDGVVEKYESCD